MLEKRCSVLISGDVMETDMLEKGACSLTKAIHR